jgi:transcriptional regulator with XRE-family HTH domain
MKKPSTFLGDRIRKVRHFRGLSQAALATRAGVTEQTINRLEIGEMRDPRVSTLSKISQALQYSVAFFIEGNLMRIETQTDDVRGYDFPLDEVTHA